MTVTTVVVFCGMPSQSRSTDPPRLINPVECVLGENCFVQSLPDIESGPGVSDPLCGKASYDGHKGIDVRLFTLKEMKSNIAVVAAAQGKVKAVRDGMADTLVFSEADREAVAGRECGNGVVIDHGDGLETQYCHLKRGSVEVVNGQRVEAGTRLGFVGTSGLSQFPHLHLTTRRGGKWFDPLTGKMPGDSCGVSGTNVSLFSLATTSALLAADDQLLALGFTGRTFDTQRLLETGPPDEMKLGDGAVLGWAYFINLEPGDRIQFRMSGPGGFDLMTLGEPLDRHKAAFTSFAGRRRAPEKGTYEMEVSLMRDGKAISTQSKQVTLE